MRAYAAVAGLALAASTASADQITLVSVRDNTLYQSATGSLSNGAGPGFFAGTTAAGEVRRGLIAFDLSSIPAGSVITDASLTLHMSSSGAVPASVSLHTALANWGEGTSNAGTSGGGGAPATTGDATWLHTFWPASFWATPGGDFSGAASATQTVAGVASYTWSGAGMLADLQTWLGAPGSNYGWLLTGDEAGFGTAKRFDSRENSTVAFRPALSITYTVPAPGGAAAVLGGAALIGARRRRTVLVRPLSVR
jgi:hypothetical protein